MKDIYVTRLPGGLGYTKEMRWLQEVADSVADDARLSRLFTPEFLSLVELLMSNGKEVDLESSIRKLKDLLRSEKKVTGYFTEQYTSAFEANIESLEAIALMARNMDIMDRAIVDLKAKLLVTSNDLSLCKKTVGKRVEENRMLAANLRNALVESEKSHAALIDSRRERDLLLAEKQALLNDIARISAEHATEVERIKATAWDMVSGSLPLSEPPISHKEQK